MGVIRPPAKASESKGSSGRSEPGVVTIDCPDTRGSIRRRSAKVLVVDASGDVLLFRGRDPSRPADGTWWFPPGGGVEAGETDEQAAMRELLEETGLKVTKVGAPIAQRRAVFPFEGHVLDSDEVYFLVRVDRFVPTVSGWTDVERRTILEHRWWSTEGISTTEEVVYPEGLLSMLAGQGG